jgi:hypothetical protein
MFHKRIIRAATVGLTLTAVAAPAAGARPADWPINPPEHSAKVVPEHSAKVVDLRSPDARDAAAKAAAAKAAATRAAVSDLHLRRTAPLTITHGVTPAPSHKSAGTDWKDVGIIGGSGLGVLLTGLGVGFATRRKGSARKRQTAALSR